MILKKKYRSFARNLFWFDPFHDYEHSTTYHFDDNGIEGDTEAIMVEKVKEVKYKFKEDGLSEKSKDKLKDEGLGDKIKY